MQRATCQARRSTGSLADRRVPRFSQVDLLEEKALLVIERATRSAVGSKRKIKPTPWALPAPAQVATSRRRQEAALLRSAGIVSMCGLALVARWYTLVSSHAPEIGRNPPSHQQQRPLSASTPGRWGVYIGARYPRVWYSPAQMPPQSSSTFLSVALLTALRWLSSSGERPRTFV